MKPPVTLSQIDKSVELFNSLRKLSQQQVYVGIPESSAADRARKISELQSSVKGTSRRATRKRNRYAKMLSQQVTNAGLLFIHSKGSDLKHIPARPVLEPAIEANKDAISAELQAAAQLALDGQDPTPRLKRAGMASQNAARRWFTDPRNNWAPNAPETIQRKGSSQPLIDTGAMRAAITYVVKED